MTFNASRDYGKTVSFSVEAETLEKAIDVAGRFAAKQLGKKTTYKKTVQTGEGWYAPAGAYLKLLAHPFQLFAA